MSRKLHLGIVLVLLLVSILTTAVITVFIVINRYDKLLTDIKSESSEFNLFNEVKELTDKEYFGELDIDNIDIFLSEGYLKGVNSTCRYFTSDEYEAYKKERNGYLPGIGAELYFDALDSSLTVLSVNMNSAAYNSGFEVGGKIKSVNGVSVSRSNSDELLNSLSSTYDEVLTVNYVADNINSNISIKTGYYVQTCDYRSYNNIGYIRVSSIYNSTFDAFSEAVNYFEANSANGLIVDLRNCIGDDIDIASKMIDLIVPVGSDGTGSIYVAKNENGDTIKQIASDASTLNVSVVVLINDRADVAAELFAADIRDYGKGIIMGEKTTGNADYCKIFELSTGGAVLLKVAEILPYSGVSYNTIGISPDIEIKTSDAFKDNLNINATTDADNQFNKAIEYLTSSI